MAEPVYFQSTIWDMVERARTDKTQAIEYVNGAYRAPIFNFIRQRGYPPETAEDLTQEVFLQLCRSNVLERARAERGRFRTLLLAITKNVLRMHERRLGAGLRDPGRQAVPLESVRWEDLAADMTDDESFDRVWAKHVLDRAMEQFDAECRVSGSPARAALHAFLYRGLTYKDIAAELGKSVTDVGNYIHHARSRLAGLMRRFVDSYADDGREEVERLSRLL